MVGVTDNTAAPHGGEWFYPAASSRICCCSDFQGDPQSQPELRDKIMLYLHGGAYCLCSSGTHRSLLMAMVQTTGVTVLAIDYTRPPEAQWPIPVNQCLEAYEWLLRNGYSPERVMFGGDSAGGGLVVATMAAAKKAGVPMPAGGIQISPWMDMSDLHSGSWTDNQDCDYLPQDFALKFAKSYAGTSSLLEASPCNVSYEGLPPLMVEVGSKECLYDQVRTFVDQARAAGVDVTEYVEPDMVHVFPLYAVFGDENLPPALFFKHAKLFMDKIFEKDRYVKSNYGSVHAERATIYNSADSQPDSDEENDSGCERPACMV